MQPTKVLAAAMLALSGVCALPGAAAPAAPSARDAARAALTNAIAVHDWTGIAALTSFPLAIDMYQAPPVLTKAQYLQDHRKLTILFGDGDKDLLACAASAPLVLQDKKKDFGFGSWYADCNGNEFYFGQRGGKWVLTAYQNINE